MRDVIEDVKRRRAVRHQKSLMHAPRVVEEQLRRADVKKHRRQIVQLRVHWRDARRAICRSRIRTARLRTRLPPAESPTKAITLGERPESIRKS